MDAPEAYQLTGTYIIVYSKNRQRVGGWISMQLWHATSGIIHLYTINAYTIITAVVLRQALQLLQLHSRLIKLLSLLLEDIDRLSLNLNRFTYQTGKSRKKRQKIQKIKGIFKN